jgi:drug/metabolite transporter (DMT)-like permease
MSEEILSEVFKDSEDLSINQEVNEIKLDEFSEKVEINENEKEEINEEEVEKSTVIDHVVNQEKEQLTPDSPKTTKEIIKIILFRHLFPILSIIFAHIMFGLLPIFSRGILVSPTGIPLFVSLFLSYIVMFVFYIPRAVYQLIFMKNKIKTIFEFSKNWLIYVFTISQIIVVLFKFLSTKFTTATIVQLILQLTPFVVAIFSYFILKEKITFLTILCIIVSVIGGVLVMVSTPKTHDAVYTLHFTIDFHSFTKNFKLLDVVGVVLALICMVSLSVFIVIVNYSKMSSKPVSNESLFFLTSVSGVILFLILSLILQEDWGKLFKATVSDYLLLLGYTVAQFLGLIGDLYSIPIIGATKASSILALRLVTTVIISWPVLNEEMNNIWQFVGCFLVCIGVTTFIIHKIHQERNESKNRNV